MSEIIEALENASPSYAMLVLDGFFHALEESQPEVYSMLLRQLKRKRCN